MCELEYIPSVRLAANGLSTLLSLSSHKVGHTLSNPSGLDFSLSGPVLGPKQEPSQLKDP